MNWILSQKKLQNEKKEKNLESLKRKNEFRIKNGK